MRLALATAVVALLAFAAPVHAESLNEALSKAYATNPDLGAAQAALRSVDEQAAQARSGFRPTVTGSAGLSYTDEDNQATPDDSYTARTAALSVQQPLFRGGRTMAALREADSNIAAQRARLLNAEQTVLLGGVQAYLNVLRDEAVLDLNRNNEAVLSRQLRATNDRFSVGEVTRTDVSQANARLAGATAGRVQAEGALSISRANYQQVFGVAPAQLVKPDVKLQLPASLDDVVAAAEKNNPGVTAADHLRDSAGAVLDSVKGERLPTLAAEGQVRRTYDNGSSSLDRQDGMTVGVTLSVPLYEAGSTSSRIRQAKQNVARSSREYDSAERSAVQQAISAWQGYETAKATRESRRSQVAAASTALDGVREEANVGNRTVLDTLDAEQEYLDARVGLVRAEYDEILAQYQVLAAMGRLTARELQLPVEYYDETSYSKRVRHQWIGSDVE